MTALDGVCVGYNRPTCIRCGEIALVLAVNQMGEMDVDDVKASLSLVGSNIWECFWENTNPYSLSKKLHVILDTNTLLINLPAFDILKQEIFEKYGEEVVFVIPFIVQEELEYIKSLFSNHKDDLKYSARQALKLCDYWTSDNRAIHLQDPRIAEYTYGMTNAFNIRNNDDMAVHCALYYQDWYGRYYVAMCSEDRGVRLTARSVNVTAYSVKMLARWARRIPASRIFYAMKDVTAPAVTSKRRHARNQGKSKHSKTVPTKAPRRSTRLALQAARAASGVLGRKATTSATLQDPTDQMMVSLGCLMLGSLSAFVEAAMLQKYGKSWESHLMVPKPYSIVNALLAIDRLWSDVFSPLWDEVNQVIHNKIVVQHLAARFLTGAACDADVWDTFEDIKQLWIAIDPSSLIVASSRHKVSTVKLQTQMKLARLAETFEKLKKSGGATTS